jgi:hypothetical protein
MLNFFKYLIYFLIFTSIVLFYFLFTPLGHKNIYSFVGNKLSHKADMNIEVKSIDISHYPQVRIVMNIERKAKLTLWGYLDDALVDMDYTLTSDCIATEHCKIDDDINIGGHVKGAFTKLTITGKGFALDGNVSYSGIKYPNKAEDITLKMRDINSTKLLKLLGQTAIIKGKANADLHFSLMDEKHKKGYLHYEVKDEDFKGIPLDIETKIDFNNAQHTFTIHMRSPTLKLDISKGTYDQDKKKATAFYTLDVQDLTKLETLLGYRYQGKFYAMGEMAYEKYVKITGLTKSFGGMTEFVFEKDTLDIHLNNVLLQDILHLLHFPALLTAHTTGDLSYGFIDKKLIAKTKLSHAKFMPSKLVNVIRKKSDVNLLKEHFDNSTLNLSYQDNTILGDLKLKNKHSHVYLTNTKINTSQNTINAYFDVKMQRQEFSGKVFGSLDNPRVNLNMQKLIRYQMDKQVDKMIGKNNRKIMEKMPMGGVAKDVATDMGASFMKVFF